MQNNIFIYRIFNLFNCINLNLTQYHKSCSLSSGPAHEGAAAPLLAHWIPESLTDTWRSSDSSSCSLNPWILDRHMKEQRLLFLLHVNDTWKSSDSSSCSLNPWPTHEGAVTPPVPAHEGAATPPVQCWTGTWRSSDSSCLVLDRHMKEQRLLLFSPGPAHEGAATPPVRQITSQPSTSKNWLQLYHLIDKLSLTGGAVFWKTGCCQKRSTYYPVNDFLSLLATMRL